MIKWKSTSYNKTVWRLQQKSMTSLRCHLMTQWIECATLWESWQTLYSRHCKPIWTFNKPQSILHLNFQSSVADIMKVLKGLRGNFSLLFSTLNGKKIVHLDGPACLNCYQEMQRLLTLDLLKKFGPVLSLWWKNCEQNMDFTKKISLKYARD